MNLTSTQIAICGTIDFKIFAMPILTEDSTVDKWRCIFVGLNVRYLYARENACFVAVGHLVGGVHLLGGYPPGELYLVSG